jgi:hypothetical protein
MTDLAKDADFRRRMQEGVAALTKDTWFHSIELPNGRLIPGVVSVEALKARLHRYPIPWRTGCSDGLCGSTGIPHGTRAA